MKIAIIGGSGFYDLKYAPLKNYGIISTPFGETSSAIIEYQYQNISFLFLARHGEGHLIPPSAVNYRANIYALKSLGVSDIISICSVGSLREDFTPGEMVLINQYIDQTHQRNQSFFESGFVVHVSMAQPVCNRLNLKLLNANPELKSNATYICIEGPQYSTLAESLLYQQWHCDVIGMTGMPEAKLAREAEICYASIALITDYDCWRNDTHPVEATDVAIINQQSILQVDSIIKKSLIHVQTMDCSCKHALDKAIVSHGSNFIAPEKYDLWLKKKS